MRLAAVGAQPLASHSVDLGVLDVRAELPELAEELLDLGGLLIELVRRRALCKMDWALMRVMHHTMRRASHVLPEAVPAHVRRDCVPEELIAQAARQ